MQWYTKYKDSFKIRTISIKRGFTCLGKHLISQRHHPVYSAHCDYEALSNFWPMVVASCVLQMVGFWFPFVPTRLSSWDLRSCLQTSQSIRITAIWPNWLWRTVAVTFVLFWQRCWWWWWWWFSWWGQKRLANGVTWTCQANIFHICIYFTCLSFVVKPETIKMVEGPTKRER